MLKVGLFKIPSFKIKNNASVVYPHQTRAPYTTPIPASLNDHICTFLTSVIFTFLWVFYSSLGFHKIP